MPQSQDVTVQVLSEVIASLKEQVERLSKENAELRVGGPLNDEELGKAEDILVAEGASLSHDEIRKLLQKEGVSEPVINHVISKVVTVLKKVKSGTVFSWE